MKKHQYRTSRRKFLYRMTGVIGTVPTLLPGAVLGLDQTVAPSEQITLAGIGIRHRGAYVLDRMLAQSDVRFLSICDVRSDRRKAVQEMVNQRYNNQDCTVYRDFRELLERDDIDTVLIATGDRWHAIASGYAARAGKDIYSEKPCALTIGLCQKLAETMNSYGRIFQGGTQRRNVENFRIAASLARSGKLGKIHTVHASIYYLSIRYDWLPSQLQPERDVLDWDLWLGPAPWRPYNEAYVNGDWRGHYDFDSGAKLLDWGAHTVDLCQWALDMDGTTPVQYWPEGDRVYALYENGVKLVMRPDGWLGLGTCPIRFEGDEGWVEAGDSGQIVVYPDRLRNELGSLTSIEGTDPAGHVRNFFDCVKSRQQPVCNANVIRSSHIACHAAALSWILGRELRFDPRKEDFLEDTQASRMRHREPRGPWYL